MSLYVSQPSQVDAVHWTGDNYPNIQVFASDKVAVDADGELTLLAGKHGAQHWVPVPKGHWLVCQPGDKTDIWPVDNDYFESKYAEADDDALTLADLREVGLLWLINCTVFHPRGFALGISPDGNWAKVFGDGLEPWLYLTRGVGEIAAKEWGADPALMPPGLVEDQAAFEAVNEFFAEIALRNSSKPAQAHG